MTNLYLKFPTLEDEEKIMEYIEEYISDNPNAKPLGLTKETNYIEWLEKRINEHIGLNLEEDRVPSSVYLLIENEEIVGHVSIRHNINNEFLSRYGGHIGYGIRPSQRRKHYATKMLYLALEKCRELGLEKVLVSCKKENIGSAKTIENNYGVLEEEIFIEEENEYFKKYWIDIEYALGNKNDNDMKIEYRFANEDDAYGIEFVAAHSWKSTYTGFMPEEYLDNRIKNIDANKEKTKEFLKNTNTYLVATVDSNIVGICHYQDSKNEKYKDSGLLGAIYVLEDYQRLGIGKELFKRAITGLIEMGYNSMYLECLKGNDTIDFYTKYDGRITEEVDYPIKDFEVKAEIVVFDDLKSILSNKLNNNEKNVNKRR